MIKLLPEVVGQDWVDAFEKYESISGVEPMHQSEVNSGEMSPRDSWQANVKWLLDMAGDVANIQTPYDDD